MKFFRLIPKYPKPPIADYLFGNVIVVAPSAEEALQLMIKSVDPTEWKGEACKAFRDGVIEELKPESFNEPIVLAEEYQHWSR